MDKELEDQFYEQVAREITANNYQPAPMARAVEKSAGNSDLAKSLYIKFRIEQLVREYDQEIRRRQHEAEEHAIAERRQAAARAQAHAEEKIRQEESDNICRQRELKRAKRARAEKMRNFGDNVAIGCFFIPGSLILGLVTYSLLMEKELGGILFSIPLLLLFIIAVYSTLKARKKRMSDRQDQEPPEH